MMKYLKVFHIGNRSHVSGSVFLLEVCRLYTSDYYTGTIPYDGEESIRDYLIN